MAVIVTTGAHVPAQLDNPQPFEHTMIPRTGNTQDSYRVDMAAKLKRWEFMLTIAPIPAIGGTGFPVNALATF
jgi:hypothetical protein